MTGSQVPQPQGARECRAVRAMEGPVTRGTQGREGKDAGERRCKWLRVSNGSWASNVLEWNVAGHFDREAGGEGRNLFVDVFFEAVGLPAAHLLDGWNVCTVEEEGHGAPGAQGMAADVGRFVAHVVESDGAGSCFDTGVDVGRGDIEQFSVEWVGHCGDGGGEGTSIRHDVVDSAGQRFDRAVGRSSAVLVDALGLDAVFLSGNDQCSFGGKVQLGKGGCWGNDAAGGIPEGDVLDTGWDGLLCSLLGAGLGIFADSEEVVEGCVAEVGLGFQHRVGARVETVGPVVIEELVHKFDWNGKLWQRGRVLPRIVFEDACKRFPVPWVYAVFVGGVWAEVQFEGLADGA